MTKPDSIATRELNPEVFPVPERQSGAAKPEPGTRDSLSLYLQEIGRYRLISREEEKALALRYQKGNDSSAAQELITANLRLVVRIAMDFRRYGRFDFLDLIQEGNLGLVHAVEKFDPHRSIKYSYYASFWIRAYILRYILNNWRLVKVGTTQNQRKLFYNLEKEKQKLLKEGYRPDPELIAEKLNVQPSEVVEMSQRLSGRDLSLDSQPPEQDAQPALSSRIADTSEPAEEHLSRIQRRRMFSEEAEAFRHSLSPREADIYDRRILAEDPFTLEELGNQYGVSRERIRQIEERIIGRLSGWMHQRLPNFREEYAEMAG